MSTVLLDSDGVLGDFVSHCCNELRERGLPVPETIDHYEIFDILEKLDTRSFDAARGMMLDEHFWSTMPVYENALMAVTKIREAGHRVVVVTSPWISCVGWEFARRSWLKRHFDIGHKDVIPTGSKSDVYGHVFVDDLVRHVHDWQKCWPASKSFVMNRSWNAKEATSCPRIEWNKQGIEDLLVAAGRYSRRAISFT